MNTDSWYDSSGKKMDIIVNSENRMKDLSVTYSFVVTFLTLGIQRGGMNTKKFTGSLEST